MWPDLDLPRTPWPDFPPRWASAWGDDEFGLYADLRVGLIEQRFRWIEPGSFWMGSLPKERKALKEKNLREWADQHESPRHRVTLTQGYWLADTPCTQALWEAVMGENPSHFSDGSDARERPVEQVSWDRVQEFLKALNGRLPQGFEAELPTEAQWEYAARAGSESSYWWGDKPEAERANWDRLRERPTAVKTYAANPWGLYDVHGNVWEWCAGSRRKYDEAEATDPPDGQDKDVRALRGGSWNVSPGDARSAFRHRRHRDFGWLDFGFRLALRSTSPGQEGGGAAVRPEGDPG
jgi:formylglycine-generating enzyme required for sulfatase activity